MLTALRAATAGWLSVRYIVETTKVIPASNATDLVIRRASFIMESKCRSCREPRSVSPTCPLPPRIPTQPEASFPVCACMLRTGPQSHTGYIDAKAALSFPKKAEKLVSFCV